jgi:hypothetical protein
MESFFVRFRTSNVQLFYSRAQDITWGDVEGMERIVKLGIGK